MKDKAIKDAMNSIENRIRHVYNQGREDGLNAGIDNSILIHAYDNGYESGLTNAWGCARKIASMPTDISERLFNQFGFTNIIANISPSKAVNIIREYEEKLKLNEEKLCDSCTEKHDCQTKFYKTPITHCTEYKAASINQTDDEIKIGDEILNKWGTRGVVIEISPQFFKGTIVYSVLWRNEEQGCLDKSDWDSYEVWKKTGRTFSQIAEVLEQMKGEEE